MAYDSVNQRFLVVWEGFNYEMGENILGQLVNPDGSLYNTASDVNFIISSAVSNQYAPRVAYDPFNQRFLVVWYDYRSQSVYDIYGQELTFDGSPYNTPVNTNFAVLTGQDLQGNPSAAYGNACQNILIVFQTYTDIGVLSFDQSCYGPDSYSVTLPAGTTAADYRIVAVPLRASDPNPVTMLGGQIGTYDTSLMRIFAYDAETQTYTEYPFTGSVGNILPGDAAWFLFRNGQTLTLEGTETPVTVDLAGRSGCPVEIGQGWNLIGNPFNFEVSVSSIIIKEGDIAVPLTGSENSITQGVFWVWSNGGYAAASTLPAGTGGWIYKNTAGFCDAFFTFNPTNRSVERGASETDVRGLRRPPAPPGLIVESSGDGTSGCFIKALEDE